MMFSVLQTVLVWGLNPRHWLSAFFDACAAHGGQTPTDLRAFLPWQMTEERGRQLAQPMLVQAPTFGESPRGMAEPAGVDTS